MKLWPYIFFNSAFSSMCSYSYLWSTFSMKYSNYQWTKSQTNHQSITDRHSKNEGENNQLTTVLLEKCEDDLYQNLTKYLFLRARKQESSEYHNCSLHKKLVDRPEFQFHGEWFAGRVVKFKHPKCQPIIEFQHSSGRNRLVCTSFCYCHIVYLINNTLSSEQIRPKIGSAIPEMSTNSARLQVVPIIMSLVVSVIAMTCYCVLDECLMNSIAASLESQLGMYFFFSFFFCLHFEFFMWNQVFVYIEKKCPDGYFGHQRQCYHHLGCNDLKDKVLIYDEVILNYSPTRIIKLAQWNQKKLLVKHHR